jgi:O-antigen/teichoic acid export membrane protein
MVVAAVSEPLVGLIYGPAWLPAAAALSWLVVAASTKLYTDLAYDFLVVLGRSGTLFMIQTCSLVILVPVLAGGALLFGLPGLAGAQALVSGCVLLPLYLRQLSQAGVVLRGTAAALWPPVAASLGAGGLAYGLSRSVSEPAIVLGLAGATAAGVSVGLLYLRRGQLKSLSLVRRQGSAPVQEWSA